MRRSRVLFTKRSVTEGGRTIEAYSLDNPHSTGYIIPYIPDAELGFVTDMWSPAPQIPPAKRGTTALVKGVQKMGIQMDHVAGGHGGVTISPIWPRRCSRSREAGNVWGRPPGVPLVSCPILATGCATPTSSTF
jgi:hypothetical protein